MEGFPLLYKEESESASHAIKRETLEAFSSPGEFPLAGPASLQKETHMTKAPTPLWEVFSPPPPGETRAVQILLPYGHQQRNVPGIYHLSEEGKAFVFPLARTALGTVWTTAMELAECQFRPMIGEELIPYCAKRMKLPAEYVQFLLTDLQQRFQLEPTPRQAAQWRDELRHPRSCIKGDLPCNQCGIMRPVRWAQILENGISDQGITCVQIGQECPLAETRQPPIREDWFDLSDKAVPRLKTEHPDYQPAAPRTGRTALEGFKQWPGNENDIRPTRFLTEPSPLERPVFPKSDEAPIQRRGWGHAVSTPLERLLPGERVYPENLHQWTLTFIRGNWRGYD